MVNQRNFRSDPPWLPPSASPIYAKTGLKRPCSAIIIALLPHRQPISTLMLNHFSKPRLLIKHISNTHIRTSSRGQAIKQIRRGTVTATRYHSPRIPTRLIVSNSNNIHSRLTRRRFLPNTPNSIDSLLNTPMGRTSTWLRFRPTRRIRRVVRTRHKSDREPRHFPSGHSLPIYASSLNSKKIDWMPMQCLDQLRARVWRRCSKRGIIGSGAGLHRPIGLARIVSQRRRSGETWKPERE